MTLVDRDHALEHAALERVARVAQEPGFPQAVIRRLNDVEHGGGPDGGGVTSAAAAFREALDEYVDGPAWTIVGLTHLATKLEAGEITAGSALEARLIVEEAMAHAAHAAHLMRGAIDLTLAGR